jgi:hypothetical protein
MKVEQVICPTMDPEIDRGPEQLAGEPELDMGSLRM